MSRTPRLAAIGALLLSTVGCDQATKQIAEATLRGEAPRHFLGGLVTLTYRQNPGAFLSLGEGLHDGVRFAVFTGGVAVFLLVLAIWLLRRRDLPKSEVLGAGLLLAGGVGNLLDRVFRDGLVVDFLHLGTSRIGTGIFNIADVAITAGVVILAFSLRRDRTIQPLPPKLPLP